MLNQLNLYGVIGEEVTASTVKAALAEMDQTQPLLVKIDSEGGSVFEGFSIANAIQSYPGPKKAIIEPAAFSIASYIATAFDEVEIVANGYFMLHMPYTEVSGDSTELAKQSELLASLEKQMVQAYCDKTGKSEQEIKSILNNETFLNAEQSVALGLATRVVTAEKKTRIQAKNKMPLKVLASLRCEGRSGDNCEPTKEKLPVSNTQTPVAATVTEIKAAFPKAKAEFIVRCLERSLPMASVASAAAEELMAENEKLMAENEQYKAKIAAMEEEMKAKAESEEESVTVTETEVEPEEEMVEAKAKAKGAKPIARAASASPVASAKALWRAAVNAEQANGLPRAKAILAANRNNPGLRERMLAEANSK